MMKAIYIVGIFLLWVSSLHAQECGKANLISSNVRVRRVAGGKTALPGNFPWQAGLYLKNNGAWEQKCGGTLISPGVILTAAHCVAKEFVIGKLRSVNTEDVRISLGKINRNWNTSEETEIKTSVKQIILHPNYIGSPLDYGQDIAVLLLEKDVTVSSSVQPACVDFQKKYINQDISDIKGYVAGWGSTEEKLKYSGIRILDFQTCFSKMQSIKPLARLTPDKLCAATETVIQNGDGGGGLIFKLDGSYYVSGLNSINIHLDSTNNFATFTNVNKYLDWISSVLP